MGRLGLLPHRLISFAQEVSRLPYIEIEGLMTHLSSADNRKEDEFTKEQIKSFSEISRKLEANGIKIKLRHAANSVAALRFPQSHFDMIRPGLALFGMWSSDDKGKTKLHLEPVASLVTKISYLKRVPPGTSISYGRSFITKKESKIATLPLGYVDGIFRSLSNRGVALVRNQRAPIIGTVCMDQTIIDVTDIADIKVGDEVVLFGRQGEKELSLVEVAQLAGTIPYEILARIDGRVPRVHLQK